MENDFYLTHLHWESELKKAAEKKKVFTIIRNDTSYYSPNYVSNEFSIQHEHKICFRFNLKTISEPISTFIMKNKKIYSLIDENDVDKFIRNCEEFINKLLIDYSKINQNFYIRDWIVYYDEIPIKKTIGDEDITSVYIKINFDGTYSLDVNNVNIAEYTTIEDIVSSQYIQKMRRNIFYNILRFFNLF